MKLSEAIREGAKLRPQGLYQFFSGDLSGKLCSCALGAAYEGSGGKAKEGLKCTVLKKQIKAQCSVDLSRSYMRGSSVTLYKTIAHYNDIDCKSREEIADMLEANGY